MIRIGLLTSLGWLLTGVATFGQNSLGLAYELAQVKAQSERILQLALLKEPAKAGAVKKNMIVKTEVVKKYIAVKAEFDPILTQLEADIRVRNSLKRYKALDRIAKGSTNLGSMPATGDDVTRLYTTALRNAYDNYTKLTNTENEGFKADEVEPSDIISGATLLFDIVKDIRDARIKRVENVVTLLESLRLSPVDGIDKTDTKGPSGKTQARK